MPSLKDLQCSVELASTNGNGSIRLREFGTTYSDGCVETFIAVPDHPQSFAVRLLSTKFIAPGLAMYVFIDGVYQCNRNRQNLKLRKPPDRKSLVNFVVRQKEEAQDDGSMVARDWSFEKLDTVSANEASNPSTGKALDHLGCIEVVVLRCAGLRNANSAATKPMPLNLDGSGDAPNHMFGLDRWFDSYSAQFDDRLSRDRHENNEFVSSQVHSGPPPPLPSPSHNSRRYYDIPEPSPTIPVSRIQRSRNSPVSVRYGSGPIPRQSRTTSMHAPAPSFTGSRGQDLPFDPQSLDDKLWSVINRDRTYPPSQAQPSPTMPPDAPSSQLPGSWPDQLGGGDSPIMRPGSYVASALPAPGVALGLQSPQQNTRVSWQEHLPKPSQGWNNEQGWEDKGYDSEVKEETPSSWGSGDPWDAQKQGSPTQHDRTEKQTAPGWDFPIRSRRTSVTKQSVRTAPWSTSSEFHTAQTQPHGPAEESGIDEEDWTHVKASPGSITEWVATNSVRPSESISRMAPSSTTTDLTKDDAPTEILLGSRLQSLKNAERERRIAVAPPPNEWGVPEHPRSISHLVDGFSTFERSIRGDLGSGGSYAKSKTKERDIQKLWDDLSPLENGRSRREADSVRDIKANSGARQSSPQVAMNDNGWSNEEFELPVSALSSASSDGQNSVKTSIWDDPTQSRDDAAGIDSWQAEINGWTAPTKARSSANESNPWMAYSESKKQPLESKKQLSESQKAKHSRIRAVTAEAWPTREVPPPAPVQEPNSEHEKENRKAEPTLKVSREEATKRGVDHQVRAGKGSKYGHAIGRPEYVDSLDKPYAVFRFKYRSHETLRKLLGNDVVPSDPSHLTVSPVDQLALAKAKEDPENLKEQLKNVPKDTLIKGLLEMQNQLDKAKAEAMQVTQTEVEGMKRTKDWVRGQSRQVSEKNKPKTQGNGGWKGEAGWEMKSEW